MRIMSSGKLGNFMRGEKKFESLENWRKSQELSQSELANKLGINQATVSRIEKGGPCTSEIYEKLKALGFSGHIHRTDLPGLIDMIEEAMGLLAQRGIKPPNAAKAHELRKLVAKVLEESPGSQVPLVDRVEKWIRMAEAIRK